MARLHSLRRLRSYLASFITTRDVTWAILLVAVVVGFVRPRLDDASKTGRELDLKIAGQGYFTVEHRNNSRRGFVRNGSLGLNSCGQFCAGRSTQMQDWIVQPPLTIPSDATSIFITHDGIVSFSQNGSTYNNQAGQIQLAKFVNPEGLREIVDGIVEETNESGAAMQASPGDVGLGFIEQGRLESVPRKTTFDPTMFVCVACCGAAMVCVRETRQIRRTLPTATA